MVVHDIKNTLTIGFIGMGSRGLSVLERILSVAKKTPHQRIDISIFEPNKPGCGVHHPDQPDYLLLNTMASQIGIYPDESALSECNEAAPRLGPNFFEWCLANDIRVTEQGHIDQDAGRPVLATDFLPRHLIGGYLADSFQDILASAPEQVQLTVYAEKATRLKLGPWQLGKDTQGYQIFGENGTTISVDRLILTTGHEEPQKPKRVTPGQAILLQGLGLTAMDQLAAFSQGLGGAFLRSESESCVYQASGFEPEINLQSREGLTFWARPNTPEDRERHRPIVLTQERLHYLRRTLGSQLDFDADILPLMKLEMRGAALAIRMAEGSADKASACLMHMAEIGSSLNDGIIALREHLQCYEKKLGALDCEAIIAQEIPKGLNDLEYQAWIINCLDTDLAQARIGLLGSPIKAAAEVWRDLREPLRSVVDFQGLTSASHRRFYTHWVRVINRLVAGPQMERSEDLLALIEAGIVKMRHPKSPVNDTVPRLAARVASVGICGVREGVIADLHRVGHVRAVVAAPGLDGIETDRNCRAVHKNGDSIPNLWILGPATEGSSYYNHYIPAPGAPNRAMADAHRVARQCCGLDDIIQKRASA